MKNKMIDREKFMKLSEIDGSYVSLLKYTSDWKWK